MESTPFFMVVNGVARQVATTSLLEVLMHLSRKPKVICTNQESKRVRKNVRCSFPSNSWSFSTHTPSTRRARQKYAWVKIVLWADFE